MRVALPRLSLSIHRAVLIDRKRHCRRKADAGLKVGGEGCTMTAMFRGRCHQVACVFEVDRRAARRLPGASLVRLHQTRLARLMEVLHFKTSPGFSHYYEGSISL
jgi:hypothetical protein